MNGPPDRAFLGSSQQWTIRQAVAIKTNDTGIANRIATTPVAESLKVRKLNSNSVRRRSDMTDFSLRKSTSRPRGVLRGFKTQERISTSGNFGQRRNDAAECLILA